MRKRQPYLPAPRCFFPLPVGNGPPSSSRTSIFFTSQRSGTERGGVPPLLRRNARTANTRARLNADPEEAGRMSQARGAYCEACHAPVRISRQLQMFGFPLLCSAWELTSARASCQTPTSRCLLIRGLYKRRTLDLRKPSPQDIRPPLPETTRLRCASLLLCLLCSLWPSRLLLRLRYVSPSRRLGGPLSV